MDREEFERLTQDEQRGYCKAKGLPYIEKDGRYINTKAFSKAGAVFLKKGKYCDYPRGSKGYFDFWNNERIKCLEGCTLGMMYITGYHYFFLNYHLMEVPENPLDPKSDTIKAFGSFWKLNYDFFNIVQYAQNVGLNLPLIKPRGCGASEMAASMGARDYSVIAQDVNGNKKLRRDVYFAAEDPMLSEDGVVSKCFNTIDFLNEYTAFDHDNSIKDAGLHRVAGYRDKQRKPHQTGGEIIGQVLDKPDKVRGKRGYFIFWEESGANPKLSQAIQIGLPLTKRSGVVTGTHLIWGTSNFDPKGVDAFKKVLTNPVAYDCLAFKNVWEDADGRPVEDLSQIPWDPRELIVPREEVGLEHTGYFIPVYESDSKFMDEHGNPDREAALAYYKQERLAKEAGDGDTDLELYKGDNPFTMSEALFKRGSNFFNKSKLARQLQDITVHRKYPSPERGDLFWEFEGKTNRIKGINWEPNKNGKFIIMEHPQVNDLGQKFENLYIGGIDSIDKGKMNSQVEDKGSQFCIMIKKRMYGTTGNFYVAYYMDRPDYEDEAYDNAAKLLYYYNCQGNLEDSKTTIVTYFRQKKWLRFLYKQPRLARADKVTIKDVNKYGTPVHEKYVLHGLELIKRYVDSFSHNLYFSEQVQQLLQYDYEKKGKFDMVAAMQMCEIADEDMQLPVAKEEEQEPDPYRIGFYRDSAGRKRWGKIPDSKVSIRHQKKKTISYIDAKTNTVVYND